jgi:apolipoprotein N-acyltransferase
LLLVRAAPSAWEAAVRAWLGVAGLLTATHAWLAPETGPFLLLAALAVGALWLPWGAGVHALLGGRLTPIRVLAAAVLLPAGWVGLEYLRAWEYLGGPFGLLGASQWNAGPMLAPAALGQVWAVSLLLVAANVGLAVALVPGASGRARAAGAVVAAAALGAGPLCAATLPGPGSGGSVRVGVVQAGLVADPAERLAAGIRATEALAGRGVGLVVWGESSVGYDLATSPKVRRQLVDLARRTGTDLLVNVDSRRPDKPGIYKSTILVTPTGTPARYDKLRLVPFGEYIPLRPLFGWVGRITDAAAEDRRRGDHLEVMAAGGTTVGPLVCFESAFPDMAASLARRGARLLVVQSSTSTFQGSWAPAQHASLASVRAVETGLPVVHATLTGVTTVVDARGRVLASIPAQRPGDPPASLVLDVPMSGPARPPAVTLGVWLPRICLLLATAAVLVGWLRARTSATPRASSAAPGRGRPGDPGRR